MNVRESPGSVEKWGLESVHGVNSVGLGAIVVQVDALELLVEASNPRVLTSLAAASNLVNLVLEFLKTWREKQKGDALVAVWINILLKI